MLPTLPAAEEEGGLLEYGIASQRGTMCEGARVQSELSWLLAATTRVIRFLLFPCFEACSSIAV